MRINLTKPIAIVAIGSMAIVGLASTAGASAPVPANGQDGIHDEIVAGGSDTTYVVDGDIATLYNRSPGCKTNNSLSASAPLLADCLLGGQQNAPQANFNDNGDHNIVSHTYPTGSGAGIAGTIAASPVYDFARSSRAATPTELGSANTWGFAKDAIAIGTLPGRATGSFTKAQLQNVWNCTYTTWGQLTGNLADTTPIHPYSMNTSSGTYASFQAYLGFDPNLAPCVTKLQDGTAPFENDWKPIIADAAAKVTAGDASYAAKNIIWWGSFGEFKTYLYKAPGVAYWSFNTGSGTVDLSNATVANDTYPITRFLYRIAPKSTISLTGTNGANQQISDTGATGGKAGATRGYIKWACQPSSYFDAAGTNTALNPYDGTTYFAGITKAIGDSGFQRVPAAQRTAGACNYAS